MKKGFTLIELLVVLVVMSVLGYITFLQFEEAKAKARDVARKADLHEVSKAIKLYYADYGHLPQENNIKDPDINSLWGKPFVVDGYTYMKELPKEKTLVDKPYCYKPGPEKDTFQLFAQLESKSDSDCKKDAYSCGERSYCYTDTIYAIIQKG